MKYLIAIFVFIAMSCAASRTQLECDFFMLSGQAADTSYYVKTKEYKGYIFPSTYKEFTDNGTETYTLTVEEVGLIEEIIARQYKQAYLSYSSTSSEVSIKNLKGFDRQYFGFYNQKGQKEAFVYLARINRKTKKYFQCFDRVMSLGFGEIYEKNQRFFNVNLATQKLYLK